MIYDFLNKRNSLRNLSDQEFESMAINTSAAARGGSDDIQNDPDLMPITKWLDRQGVFGN